MARENAFHDAAGIQNKNGDADKTTLLLKYKPPFDLGPILAFLKPRAIKGVELVTDSSYATLCLWNSGAQ